MNLVDYVRSMAQQERIAEVVDPRLTDVQLDDAEYVVGVALRCVDANALKRPKMSQVCHMLESEDPTLVSLSATLVRTLGRYVAALSHCREIADAPVMS